MLSFLPQWWQGQVCSSRGRRRRPTRRLAWRPSLEILEDRTAPSTIPVFRSGDDNHQPGTLRWAVAHARSGDTIVLSSDLLTNTPLMLTQGELVLNQDYLTIVSAGIFANSPVTVTGGGHSRVFEVANGAHVTLSNLIVTGGDGVANNPSSTSFDDGDGGGILNLGTLTVSASTLSGNSAFDGGGIANLWGTLTVSGCTLSGNLAPPSYFSDEGGGIFNFVGTVTVNNSMLSGNAGGFGGGGIDNRRGTLRVSASTLSGNSGGFGGGIDNYLGTLTVTGCTLSGNSGSGGGIFNDGSATVSGCTLSSNSGSGIANNGSLTVCASTLSGNSAPNGGGIFNESGPVTITGSTLSGNSATEDGGGVYTGPGTLTITGSTLSGNSAGHDGGGIYNRAVLILNNSTITGNSAGYSGGGIFNPGGSLTVSGSTFSMNTPDNIFGPYTDGGGNIFG
jgi:hypothetical protein